MTTQSSNPANRNASSKILSPEENKIIFNLLAAKKCSTLATTVVQVQLAHSNSHAWIKKCTGVLCFVKDSALRSYFLRVFNVKDKALLWEQELYYNFEYKKTKNYFHTFQAHDCVAGFNFADVNEATQFYNILTEKLRSRKEKKEIKQQQQKRQQQQQNSQKSSKNAVITNENSSKSAKEKPTKKKDKGPRRISKLDISGPTDFRHVEHLGWDKDTGSFISKVTDEWKDLFSTIGLTGAQLNDAATLKVVQTVVEAHGGLEQATRELKSQIQGQRGKIICLKYPNRPYTVDNVVFECPISSIAQPPSIPPSVPSSGPPSAPSKKPPQPVPSRPSRPPPRPISVSRPPPPIPTTTPPGHYPSRPAPTKEPPPLPPSHPKRPSIPSPQSGPSPVAKPLKSPFTVPPPPPVSVQPATAPSFSPPPIHPVAPSVAPSAPIPPPAPIPPSASIPPPPPPPPPGPLVDSTPSSTQNRLPATTPAVKPGPGSFLDQIQSGVNLRKTEPADKADVRPSSSRISNNLLDSIRSGITLKKVDMDQKDPLPPVKETGILGALQIELAKINDRVTATDSEDSDTNSDDWD
ncbi:Neural Wiskott-Aldrich syndrome protein [Trichoplax sp. H2]|nr:Neural Wiskott-Aldrich syndrome protein [Trichoplax sp. H2]|eukprot:RDD42657.1 Neural Wiskott-Aldrich syndrome protein [Trichoplax sp. H2]